MNFILRFSFFGYTLEVYPSIILWIVFFASLVFFVTGTIVNMKVDKKIAQVFFKVGTGFLMLWVVLLFLI